MFNSIQLFAPFNLELALMGWPDADVAAAVQKKLAGAVLFLGAHHFIDAYCAH